jgi:hypothetical protein
MKSASATLAVVVVTSAIACAASGCAGAPPATKAAAPAPAVAPAPATVTPVPETLAFVAAQFGLAMQAEGITWKVLRRNVTRFDWSGRSASGDRELLYSFWMEKLDDGSAKLLGPIVAAAAANLTEGEPCNPVEQPPPIVQALGVDRVVTVCFEPSTFYGREHRYGVLHGIVRKGALTLAVVLSNDRTALVPQATVIGARGAP